MTRDLDLGVGLLGTEVGHAVERRDDADVFVRVARRLAEVDDITVVEAALLDVAVLADDLLHKCRDLPARDGLLVETDGDNGDGQFVAHTYAFSTSLAGMPLAKVSVCFPIHTR